LNSLELSIILESIWQMIKHSSPKLSRAQGNTQCAIDLFTNLLKVPLWELKPFQKDFIYFKVCRALKCHQSTW
jgi:hypothetical protein